MLPGVAMPALETAETTLEVVIPVLNEERLLSASVRKLRSHLDGLPFTSVVTIADNGSSDGTWRIAEQLAAALPGVRAIHLEQRGRGRALAAAWLASDAEVVAYMDVDLSTDLNALYPLVAPILSGHSDVAIGSRLSRGARVVRGPKRELISRSYNLLLRSVLRLGIRDAQCGFKAVRASVARRLLPEVQDRGWFFDTELLVLAQRASLRVTEIPVDWIDDPDSRVDLVRTALVDLRGVGRLLVDAPRSGARRLASFAAVGVASTAAYAVIYVLLRLVAEAWGGDPAALLLTAVANTAANRRLTFGVRGSAGLARDHAGGLAAFALALVLTNAAMAVLTSLVPDPSRRLVLTVLVAANLAATVGRFALLRLVIRPLPVQPTAVETSRRNAI